MKWKQTRRILIFIKTYEEIFFNIFMAKEGIALILIYVTILGTFGSMFLLYELEFTPESTFLTSMSFGTISSIIAFVLSCKNNDDLMPDRHGLLSRIIKSGLSSISYLGMCSVFLSSFTAFFWNLFQPINMSYPNIPAYILVLTVSYMVFSVIAVWRIDSKQKQPNNQIKKTPV